MKEIFSALAYMHEQGIVHRDLKPENILLEDKDDLINIKIINFSTATILKKGSFLSGVIGTAYYIAPEVISSNYNEKCDIWSAGVVMFMLLSFYPPFDGNSDKEILEKVQRGTINYKNPIWTSISNQAKDLISKLLCPIDQRLSATEVLTHPFIVENALIADSDQQNLVSAFQNLRGFRNSNKLRDAVQTFIATQCISVHDSKTLKEVFKTIDTNGDGKLSKEELLMHYKKVMGDDHAEEEVTQIMKEVDTDNNGYINYTEFLKASISQKTLASSQNLRRAFDLFDSDKSGSISAAELKKVLQGGNNTDDHVWKQIIKAFDQNSDGEIDLREFEEIITRSL
jgi:calcium-dependent protein kinase